MAKEKKNENPAPEQEAPETEAAPETAEASEPAEAPEVVEKPQKDKGQLLAVRLR